MLKLAYKSFENIDILRLVGQLMYKEILSLQKWRTHFDIKTMPSSVALTKPQSLVGRVP